jgi:23S rRNA (adenine-N6)-dimethyltransferase
LICKSGITIDDTVIEVGAGEGIITKELIEKSKKVIAFELDSLFFEKLSEKFKNERSLELKHEDFLTSNSPTYPYKVLSNIPFNITSAIIKKLTLGSNPPKESYLIVQKEAGAKFAGKPLDTKNSQLAVILHPWFEFKVLYEFKSGDFFPKPNVDIILLAIKRRNTPLVNDKNKYQDFVTYVFNQPKPSVQESLSKIMKIKPTNLRPSKLDFDDWISLFKFFLNQPEHRQNIIKGFFAKQLRDQENLKKIHRTRVDGNWKNYKFRQ